MTANLEERARELLAEHWLSQMDCDHNMKRDRAVCSCGFVTIWEATVGDAAKAWAEHALEASGVLTQVQAEARLAALEEAAQIAEECTCDETRDEKFRITQTLRALAQAGAPATKEG